MIVEELKKAISEAVKNLGVESPKVELEHPAELSHGDYSTNIAMASAKLAKQKPRDIAERIVAELQKNLPTGVEKIEVAGAGFINFHLKKEFFADAVKDIDGNFGKNQSFAGKKVMVEFTDPNPFKEFHIGHLMDNAIGESVARIFEFHSATVKRACWQGDVGMHVAKSIWGYRKEEETENTAQAWGKAYARGSEAFETDEAAKKEITTLNKVIYEKSDSEVNKLYDSGRQISLDYFEEIYRRVGTKFDHYFFESKEGVEGKKIVEEFLKKGVFEQSEGAVVFKGEQYGLHTRVFINSQGLPTYEAKELGLNKKKFEVEKDISLSIILSANEISEYFKVLLKVMSLVYPPIAAKTKHLSHGFLKLSEGKMSSRKGNVITGEGLIQQVKQLVFEKIKEREMSEAEKETLAEIVAVGAIKYSILRQAIGGDIIFDFDKSISFEGDSGPYLQYSYVRAKSVLAKAEAESIKGNPVLPKEWETTVLEKLLYRFPEVVERAGTELEPHYVTTFLTELAGVFNSWYAGGKIVDATDPASPYKLALTEVFVTTMENGLWLLGIKVPERM
ncbi:MAG: arginine--tRNA ligase [Candidatus Taylorbacteria bacterium]|nr:arginine--tRNA ligase [Candidatus Taylorbacteria bacterium]